MASVSISCPSCSATDGVVRNGKSCSATDGVVRNGK
ncbi:IS1 family transposase, partial [Escherichia coli]